MALKRILLLSLKRIKLGAGRGIGRIDGWLKLQNELQKIGVRVIGLVEQNILFSKCPSQKQLINSVIIIQQHYKSFMNPGNHNNLDNPQTLPSQQYTPSQRVHTFSFADYNAKMFQQKQRSLKAQLKFRIKAASGLIFVGVLMAQSYRLYKYFEYDMDIVSGKVSEYVLDRFR